MWNGQSAQFAFVAQIRTALQTLTIPGLKSPDLCLLSSDIIVKSLNKKKVCTIPSIPGYLPSDIRIRVWIHFVGYPNPNVNREELPVFICFMMLSVIFTLSYDK